VPNGKMILLGVIIPPDLCRRVPERRRAHPPLCHPEALELFGKKVLPHIRDI
jgi:hypothetical protein